LFGWFDKFGCSDRFDGFDSLQGVGGLVKDDIDRSDRSVRVDRSESEVLLRLIGMGFC